MQRVTRLALVLFAALAFTPAFANSSVSRFLGSDNKNEAAPPVSNTVAQLQVTAQEVESSETFASSLVPRFLGSNNKDESAPPALKMQMAESSNQYRGGAASGEPDRLDSDSREFWYRR